MICELLQLPKVNPSKFTYNSFAFKDDLLWNTLFDLHMQYLQLEKQTRT